MARNGCFLLSIQGEHLSGRLLEVFAGLIERPLKRIEPGRQTLFQSGDFLRRQPIEDLLGPGVFRLGLGDGLGVWVNIEKLSAPVALDALGKLTRHAAVGDIDAGKRVADGLRSASRNAFQQRLDALTRRHLTPIARVLGGFIGRYLRRRPKRRIFRRFDNAVLHQAAGEFCCEVIVAGRQNRAFGDISAKNDRQAVIDIFRQRALCREILWHAHAADRSGATGADLGIGVGTRWRCRCSRRIELIKRICLR